ncbi:MAG: LysM peptidoglycan-binding domain-containing protein [Nitrospinota bacterium]
MRKHTHLLSACFLILFSAIFDSFPVTLWAENFVPRYAIHYIQKGDNLHMLAAFYLNSPRKWETIFQANRNVISNPNRLVVGKKLEIPLENSWTRTESYEIFKERLTTATGVHETAAEIVRLSGAYRAVHTISMKIKIEIETDSLGLGTDNEQRLASIKTVNEKFTPSALLAEITGKVETSLKKTDLEGLLKWYTSPLGSRITELEKKGSAPDNWKGIPEISDKLKDTYDNNVKRVELLAQLNSATRYTEREVELKKSLLFAAASTSVDQNNEGERTPGEIHSLVNERKSAFFSQLEEETIFHLMFQYRNLTNEELQQYISFRKKEASQKFSRIVFKTLNDSIIRSFR